MGAQVPPLYYIHDSPQNLAIKLANIFHVPPTSLYWKVTCAPRSNTALTSSSDPVAIRVSSCAAIRFVHRSSIEFRMQFPIMFNVFCTCRVVCRTWAYYMYVHINKPAVNKLNRQAAQFKQLRVPTMSCTCTYMYMYLMPLLESRVHRLVPCASCCYG